MSPRGTRPNAPGSDRMRSGHPFDVVGVGLNCVDYLGVTAHHVRPGSKQELLRYDTQPGGQVPTALVALQRWGLRTAYIGCFADDPAGELARRALAAEGVDVSACVAREQAGHPVSLILIDGASGERSVLWHRGHGMTLTAAEVPRDLVALGRAVLTDAVDLPAAIESARSAKAAGRLTMLDLDDPPDGIGELLALTDVLIVGGEVAAQLAGHGEMRAALRALAAFGPWFAAVTLGPEGALALVNGEFHSVPAFRVRVVDTTGAGDVFHAGSLYGLLQGWPVEPTLRFAAAAAALNCEQLGGRPGIPPLERAIALAGLA